MHKASPPRKENLVQVTLDNYRACFMFKEWNSQGGGLPFDPLLCLLGRGWSASLAFRSTSGELVGKWKENLTGPVHGPERASGAALTGPVCGPRAETRQGVHHYWSVLLSHQSWCLVISCYIMKPWDILGRDTRGGEEGVWFPGSETALNKSFLRVPHPESSQNQRWRFEWPPYHSSALTEDSSSCILVMSGDGGSIRTRVWSDSHLRPRSLHSDRSMYKCSSDSVRLRGVVRYNKYRKHRRGKPLFFH